MTPHLSRIFTGDQFAQKDRSVVTLRNVGAAWGEHFEAKTSSLIGRETQAKRGRELSAHAYSRRMGSRNPPITVVAVQQ
jgi:hypothetical protein